MKKILFVVLSLVMMFACTKDEPLAVTAISIAKTELELKVGESHTFKVVHSPSEAAKPNYTWQSMAYESLGFVDGKGGLLITQEGVITATKVGYSKVSVSADVLDPKTGMPFTASCIVNVLPVKAENLKLDKTEIAIDFGKTCILTCSIFPDNATSKRVYWTSSNVNVVTVSSDSQDLLKGTLKGVSAGEATIKAYIEDNRDLFATCKVTVSKAKLESLSLEENEKTVMQGEVFKLKPVFTPTYVTNKNVVWSSSDKTIATVDKDGNVNTLHSGECIITAISEDGGFEATCKVVVKPISVESIQFDAFRYNVELGGIKQLKVSILPENAENKKIKWSSSNPVVCPIDDNGVVKGNTNGSVTITAISEDGELTASCFVVVVRTSEMLNVFFSSLSLNIVNGYYTGVLSWTIKNNSFRKVIIKSCRITDYEGKIILGTRDESLLGKEIAPGKTITVNEQLNAVCEPWFMWEIESNGLTDYIFSSYGQNS